MIGDGLRSLVLASQGENGAFLSAPVCSSPGGGVTWTSPVLQDIRRWVRTGGIEPKLEAALVSSVA